MTTFDPFGFVARHLWKLWGTPAGRNILIVLCYVAAFLMGVHGGWLHILDSACVLNFALWGRVVYRQRQARLARERHQACLARIAELEAALNTSGVPGVVTFTGWDVETELARREAASIRIVPYGVTTEEAIRGLTLLVGHRLDDLERQLERRA